MRLLIIAGLCLAAAACTKSDDAKLQHDVGAVGQDLAADTRKAADAPQIHQAGDELKAAGEKADAELKTAAEKAKEDADRAAENAKHTVHEATADPPSDSRNN